ncbi:glutamate synthase large subunit [Salinibius halmophilus]|uniref:glutamate synthase large subunit n=1 Tax=Salinibius halmophilus TaxID=1853216 RepID=UPI000E667159|nr:glutamate synthase large subunit [Salinibius halmophilus]
MTHYNQPQQGLYRPEFEHDACGIGFVANLKGKKSHDIIENALTMLTCMEHRGGTGFDVKSGDGAGILIQIPHEFFAKEAEKLGFTLPAEGDYGVGMVFFPAEEPLATKSRDHFEANIAKLGLEVLGYRKVPGDNSGLGEASRQSEPDIQQIFIKRPESVSREDFDRKLFVLRKSTAHQLNADLADDNKDAFYIASMNTRTIVYKGQLTTAQVREYYLDLQNPEVESRLAMFHSRFSTNTFPAWRRAQPFRYIAHNGEINTVRGNVNWMRAREALFESVHFSPEELELIKPICNRDSSDSANLDMAVELLLLSGRPLEQVMMMLVPEAWQSQENMDSVKRAFYEYYASVMEPWDGPASLSFTDGITIGATLDRNGLRPSRYLVTDDGMLVMGSETGALCVNPATVIEKGRLEPGKIFVADLDEGRIIADDEVKQRVASKQPYGEWVAQKQIKLDELPNAPEHRDQPELISLRQHQKAFGISFEDLNMVIAPMASGGKEPLGSMGNDTPLAVLSDKPQHLSNYFRQQFAQVTNPPIDPIREEMVMSLRTYVGKSQNLLVETADHCHKVEIKQPVLSNDELAKLSYIDHEHLQAKSLASVFVANGDEAELELALERLCRDAREAVEQGYSLLIISDRGIDTDHAAIPSLLATAAVHHDLIRAGLRAKADIIVEAGDVWETHHVATLVGYGASAVNPYMAIESLVELREEGVLSKDKTAEEHFKGFVKGVNSGLLKIMSKMGISTIQSYHGAQIFEALGINAELVDKHFTATTTRIGGVGLKELAKEALAKHREGFPAEARIPVTDTLATGGNYAWRHDGERHLFSPASIRLLQHSTQSGDYEKFKEYAKVVDDQAEAAFTLRGLMEFNADRPAISIDEVEPAENIFKRFATGAMSFGSISWEAHTTLAAAMNRIGGKSNSGEGGEDPIRFKPNENGDLLRSAIKQVASGRFGVNSYYLTNADELQIKMAQGAKPGEGGQLPGHKVDAWIGRTRGSTPGVGLISPPPHHDIYSIEDLAQLIYDLKNANRDARVNVKLVSGTGVGTIAAGVTKGYADVVLIAGHDGGTGASPLSSIRHAGLPWELGLAETHQTLVKNRLRSRIVVQADGQMKTPRDLAVAALLGAEEWGVATAALVVEGCIMMRKCHLNTCPVGVATQNKDLRARFNGQVEHVVNFFKMLTQGLREIMAELGFRTVDEMIGQTQALKFRDNVDHWKYNSLDLSSILYKQEPAEGDSLYCTVPQKHMINDIVDREFIEKAKDALENQTPVVIEKNLVNTDRSVGTMLSNEISKRYDDKGLPHGTIHLKLTGSGGQSFGAFAAKGITFEMEGDANDYFGKGLSGAEMVIYPPKVSKFEPSKNILIGNVAFFGATSGKSFIRGIAGERFCVRNSGATAVVEGVGDHGCEYMTGGKAVILGRTGRNFAAGMSGGVAYVLDVDGDFASKCNMEMVQLEKVEAPEDVADLQALITEHKEKTGSDVAEALLADWDASLAKFIKVMPVDYKRMLGYMTAARESGQYETDNEVMEAAFDMHMNNLAKAK